MRALFALLIAASLAFAQAPGSIPAATGSGGSGCTPTVTVISYTNSAFTVASTTATVTLGTLATNQYVNFISVNNLTGSGAAFAGSSITGVTVSVGSSGTGSAAYSYAPPVSIFSQISTGFAFLTIDPAGSNVVAVFTSTGANFGSGSATALTAGSVAITYCTVTFVP